MAIFLFLLGMAVFAFFYALRKTVFADLLEKIKLRRQASRNRRAYQIASESNRPETVTIEGHIIHSEQVAMEDGVFIRIGLSSTPLLPVPLEMVKSESMLDSAQRGRGLLRLGLGDFAAIIKPEDRFFPAREIENEIGKLNRLSASYSIYGNQINCLVPAAGDAAAAKKEVYDALARLATLLIETGKTVDLRLRLLQGRLRRLPFPDGHVEILGFLLKYYRGEETTRAVLERLSHGRDFDTAFMAAKELGLDLAQFTIARVEHSDPENALKAVRKIRLEKFPGGIEFLIACYPRVRTSVMRSAIIAAFKAYADPGAAVPLARELAGTEAELIAAALDALSVCGDRSSLAPLHALAADRTKPAPLRAAAEDAMAKIRARLGEVEEGMLSLAGDDEPGGRLSLAEGEAAEGGLSRAGEPGDGTTP